MKSIGKWSLISATILLSLCSCERIHNKVSKATEQLKTGITEIFDGGFYSSPGGRDYCRVPLIKPWELISTFEENNEKVWYCGKRENYGTTLITTNHKTVERIGITDSIVYFRNSDTLDPFLDKGERIEKLCYEKEEDC